ncbi:MAG TPA: GNAT family N-acetyltransferase [Mucilaginibacter sp.]
MGDRHVATSADAINYIQRIAGSPNVIYWVVTITATHVPIGIITYIQRNYLPFRDVGFAFLPAFYGQGYAYESASAIGAAPMERDQLPAIVATTISENTASIKLLKKPGLNLARK